MTKRAIITGVLGQSGSYLAEYLLELGYDVYGLFKRVGTGNNYENVSSIKTHLRFHLIEGDLTDYVFMSSVIRDVKPDEFYNLGAASHVGHSFSIPTEVFRVNAEAVIAQLHLIKDNSPATRFYQASTSEILGGIGCPATGFDESFRPNPQSPYAIAKTAAYYAVQNYRTAYGLYAANGVLFNHESPRRPKDFLTRKITHGIASIKVGKQEKLTLGNLDAVRDWGHAAEFVQAMWLMLQQDKPDDYVVATGQTASVKEFLYFVCDLAGLDPVKVCESDERFMRPSDVPFLRGNASKIEKLGWKATKNWKDVAAEMFDADLKLLS